MNADNDFAALYRELGIRPGCSLDAFRRAYRRRAADLHPDRHANVDAIDLQRLNVLYAAAIRFEREHGRLPGAAVPPRGVASVEPARPAAGVRGAATPRRRQSASAAYWLTALLAVLAMFFWSRSRDVPDVPASQPLPAPALAQPESSSALVTAPQLAIGLSPDDVIALLGKPVMIDGDRWLYGPSWVRFRCLEVADWYSSPLRSLSTNSLRPTAESRRTHRPLQPENCGKQALPQ